MRNGLTDSEEAGDAGRSLKGAEHDRHPPVVSDVRDGLIAAACQVLIVARRAGDERQGVVPFRRYVDVLRERRRRRRDEEQLLLLDPFFVRLIGYLVEEGAHRECAV